MLTFLDGRQLRDDEAAFIPDGLRTGHGVFETIRLSGGRPEFWEEHWARLESGSTAIGLPPPPRLAAAEWLETLLAEQRTPEALLRLTWCCHGTEGRMLMETRPFPYRPEHWKLGFRLGLAAIRRNPTSPATRHKTCSYLDNVVVRETAKAQGLDEAILLNPNGELCEGSFTNLFFVRHGRLHTPAIACGLLPGILRHQVLKRAEFLGIPCEEGHYAPEELELADEIFVTNSLIHVMPVRQFGSRTFDLTALPLTRRLAPSP